MLQKDQPTFNDAAVALTELDEEAHVGGADSANSPVTLDVASGTAFLQFLEKKVNEAVGAHGKVVVGLLENKNPCVERTYLHETFVHSDLESASFVCHPCHASCTGDCYGAELHECHVLDLESEDAQGGAGASFVQAFQDGLRKRMEAMDLTALGNTSAEPLDHKDLMEIMEKSHGTYEVSELHEQDGDVDYKSARSEIFKVVQHGEVAETPIDSDPKLKMFEAAIAKALLDNGFLPGMTEPPTDEGLKAYSEQNVDETGVHWEEDQNSEPESGGEKTEEKGEDNQETKESLLQESSNSRGRGMVKSIAKTKLKGIGGREVVGCALGLEGASEVGCVDFAGVLGGGEEEAQGALGEARWVGRCVGEGWFGGEERGQVAAARGLGEDLADEARREEGEVSEGAH